MRSFFNKPSWATRRDEDTGSEFYRRAGQTYKDIVATSINVRERSANSLHASPCKRRRISDEVCPEKGEVEECDDDYEKRSHEAEPPDNLQLSDRSFKENTGSNTLTVRTTSISDNTTSPDIENPISESQSPSETRLCSLNTKADRISSPIANSQRKGDTLATDHSGVESTQSEANLSRHNRTYTYDNKVVKILITSHIENTKPIIIHRKMSQSLKEVRLAWCIRQNIPKELHSSIFLTWKGRRLFDVTTCRSLGIGAQNAISGELEALGDFGGSTHHIQIHMEAVTEEQFTADHRTRSTMISPVAQQQSLSNSSDLEQRPRSKIVLKSPGLDDFRINVMLNTQISRVIAAFRLARDIPSESDVCLAFDGDRLDPGSCFLDYEITDGDLIDVIVKGKNVAHN